MPGANSRLVYSTDGGRMCPVCDRLLTACRCKTAKPKGPPSDGIVRVARSTKGRKGKGVTLVTGVPLKGAELNALAKELKARCGAGGWRTSAGIPPQRRSRAWTVAEMAKRRWTPARRKWRSARWMSVRRTDSFTRFFHDSAAEKSAQRS